MLSLATIAPTNARADQPTSLDPEAVTPSVDLEEVSHVDNAVAEQLMPVPGEPLVSDSAPVISESTIEVIDGDEPCDRLWLFSTRSITSNVCRANLDMPPFRVSRLSTCGRRESSSLGEYLASISPDRAVVIYAHGNRLDPGEAITRSMAVYRNISCRRSGGPIDWVLFSWPASKQGILVHDFREKAERTDAQGLYLGWLLRKHGEASVPTALIGYSFGGRVVTGALHAMAGGPLKGRALPGEPITGANFDAGLVAPAVDTHWMSRRGYHGRATQNLDRLVLLYNRRDAVLKRYWLIEKIRGRVALGYTGPRSFGPRADGSKLSVRARDCAPFIGLQHDEIDYYVSRCRAGSEMAKLINDTFITN